MPEASTQTTGIVRKLIRVRRPVEVFEDRIPSPFDRFDAKTSTRFVQNQCWYNAVHNILYYQKHRNLKLNWVVGAQVLWANRKNDEFSAIGMRGKKYPDGHKEILTIDRFYTLDQLERRFTNTHSWLQDDDGNVYEMIYPDDVKAVMSASADPVSWRLKAGMIEGMPRDVLDQKGCELIPFSLRAQKVVLEAIIEAAEDSRLDEEGEEALELLTEIALPQLTAAISKLPPESVQVAPE